MERNDSKGTPGPGGYDEGQEGPGFHGNWNDWRWQLRNSIRDPAYFAGLGWLSQGELGTAQEVLRAYPMGVTPYYAALATGPNHPVARQFLPDPRELLVTSPCSREDPLLERRYSPVPGLIHRYPDRVLCLVSPACATYCRHCNRKRTWRAPEAVSGREGLSLMAEYVGNRPGVREVILSGGDPLLMDPETLDWFLGTLRCIPHVKVLRIGSRVPVTLPMRITDELCGMLASHRPLWLNTHFNHPSELTEHARRACNMLSLAGIPVSNQTVLLKGVNDSTGVLRELFLGLQEMLVRPYYLFHCDFAKGTDHFRTPLNKGVEIIMELWGNTSGLCVPRFVVDLPQGGGKALMVPSFLLDGDGTDPVFRTFDGRIVHYYGFGASAVSQPGSK